MGIEDIGFLIEEFEEIRDSVREMEPEDPEGEEEEEYSESLDDLRGYQERFTKYAEGLERDIRDLYKAKDERPDHDYREEGIRKEGVKTPWERGHKLGCGCPGCSAYREFHGIELANRQDHDIEFTVPRSASGVRERMEEYGEKRPCGGKHYHFFHGKRKDFGRIFGDYSGKLNLNLAGY